MITGKHMMALAILSFVAVAGCSHKPTLVDDFYGTSYKLALQSQKLEPHAQVDLRPVEGVDGEIGRRVMERHQKGVEQPAATTDNYSILFEGMNKK